MKLIQHHDYVYYCQLTQDIDKHVLGSNVGGFKTYVFYHEDLMKEDNKYPIRFRGGTRGFIEVGNNNTILDIVLYDDCFHGVGKCYDETVKEELRKYIGERLEIE